MFALEAMVWNEQVEIVVVVVKSNSHYLQSEIQFMVRVFWMLHNIAVFF